MIEESKIQELRSWFEKAEEKEKDQSHPNYFLIETLKRTIDLLEILSHKMNSAEASVWQNVKWEDRDDLK